MIHTIPLEVLFEFTDRSKLPYRRSSKCILTMPDGKIVARISHKNKYVVFPGGGVDPGETLEQSVKRECLEEAGAIIDGRIKVFNVFRFDWWEGWATNDKMRRRYEKLH